MDWFEEMYRKYCNDLPVLDVGCGHKKAFNFPYTKVDKFIVSNKKKIEADYYLDFCDMPVFEDGKFAFVRACECIEHTRTPGKALNEWVRVLKVGGIIAIGYPGNIPKFTKEVAEEMERRVKALTVSEEEYIKIGGDITHIVETPDGKKCIDVHFGLCTTVEMKLFIPSNLVILEEKEQGTHCYIVLKKEEQ